MYPAYFGLSEAPFSITPDPHYLFLSKRHQEALAHLLYGAGENGGFLQLTGEVGTGKTTVCRAFLEQLPDRVDVALILNPALTVPELLHTICDEFGIPIAIGEMSTKRMVDRLNQYLLHAHAQGRRPLLMIDEAQNLSAEVLEQIRLLTNLETPKHKLLQIFLVGQPELRELLERKGLRQVAQRITARYHLLPLNGKETRSYIQHRLAVAGAAQNPFTRAAVRRIHRLSGGVPRLINILCDRALLGAYATQHRQVSTGIVGRASRELMVTTAGSRNSPRLSPLQVAGTLSILLLGIVGLVVSSWNVTTDTQPRVSVQSIDSSPEPAIEVPLREPDATIMSVQPLSAEAVEEQVDSAPAAQTPTDIETLGIYQRTALTRLFDHWGIEFPAAAVDDPCGFADARGLRCLKGQGSWSNLRKYDRPALLQVHLSEDTSTFVVISALDESQVVLDLETTRTELPLTALDPTTFGRFMLLWKPPGKDVRVIGKGAHPESIHWLRSALARVSGSSITDQTSPVYDPGLRDQVMKFQNSRGLDEDGVVGPETLIQLNTALKDPEIPTLSWASNGE
jgi:general secretion pathway protein A